MLERCIPWPEEIQKEYKRKGYWLGLTLWDILDWTALRNPEGIAIIYENRRIKYHELLTKVDCLAVKLLDTGFKPGDRLVFQLPNIPEMIFLYFACVRVGIIPVACIPAHRYQEISFIAKHTEARGIALVPEMRGFNFLDMAIGIKEEVPSLKYILATNLTDKSKDIYSLEEMADPGTGVFDPGTLTELRPDPFDIAIFQLSGGTSGLPKIIPRTHADYVYNSFMMARSNGYHQAIRNLISMPMAHNAPLTRQVNGTVIVGGTMVLAQDSKPETILNLIEKEQVTHAAFVPTIIINLLNSPKLPETDLNSLEIIVTGAAKLNSEFAKKVPQALGCKLQSCFGMGEGLCLAVSLDDPEEINHYAVGKPVSLGDEVKIVDEGGKEVQQGEVGELLARGPYTVRGYYKAEEQNIHAFTKDGFYCSGDLARLDEFGNIVIEGRIKDTINRGGEKVSGEEVENLILTHPDVLDVAVIGMPDEVFGEKVCAYVKSESDVTLNELKGFLLELGLAKFKVPERLELVKEFPLTGVGKIAKRALRQDIADKLSIEKQSLKGGSSA